VCRSDGGDSVLTRAKYIVDGFNWRLKFRKILYLVDGIEIPFLSETRHSK
jgi:hypothetical protein